MPFAVVARTLPVRLKRKPGELLIGRDPREGGSRQLLRI